MMCRTASAGSFLASSVAKMSRASVVIENSFSSALMWVVMVLMFSTKVILSPRACLTFSDDTGATLRLVTNEILFHCARQFLNLILSGAGAFICEDGDLGMIIACYTTTRTLCSETIISSLDVSGLLVTLLQKLVDFDKVPLCELSDLLSCSKPRPCWMERRSSSTLLKVCTTVNVKPAIAKLSSKSIFC
jgi:hypothetical protein